MDDRDLVADRRGRPDRQDPPSGPLTGPSIRALRDQQVGGLTRRTLLRAAIGTGVGIWAVEVLGGTLGFAWSAVANARPKVAIGTLADLDSANPGLPIRRRLSRRTSPPPARSSSRGSEPRRLDDRCGPDRRRDGAQCAGALAALPASRLPPEPVHRGLLVPLPLPPVALRPSRDQGGRGAVRSGAARAWIATRSRSTTTASSRSIPARSRSGLCRSPLASPGSSRHGTEHGCM